MHADDFENKEMLYVCVIYITKQQTIGLHLKKSRYLFALYIKHNI